MGWRCVMVQQPAHIKVSRNQLAILTDLEHTVPLEDLDTLLIESRQSHLTAAALSALAEHGVAVMLCDAKHLPCAVLLPYAQHSRSLAVLRMQMAATLPRKNRLWQQIVQAKIINQALCLRMRGAEEAATSLEGVARRVASGDRGNLEAVAAARYFRALYGSSFYRGQEHGINAALNYGYAILRGMMARTLSVYGFLTCLGLHHANELNSFNLTDDLLEPFRPLVDLYVAEQFSEDTLLTSKEKQGLFSLLTMQMLSGGQRHGVTYAAERMVQSLIRALQLPGQPALMLPTLLPLVRHRYE